MANVSAGHDPQRFFRTSCDMLCTAGFDGDFKTISPALLGTFGYAFHEVNARPVIEFVHVEDRAKTRAEAAKLLTAGGMIVSFEIRMYAKDNSLRRLSWNALADLDKKLLHGFARDVTAQYNALESLQRKLEAQCGIPDFERMQLSGAVADSSIPVLDVRVTAQLRNLLGAAAVPVIDSLMDDLPVRLELLNSAIERGDTEAVRYQAHTMKGGSSTLGATAFAAGCAQVSQICKAGESQRLPAACAELVLEFRARVAPALQQFKRELLIGRRT